MVVIIIKTPVQLTGDIDILTTHGVRTVKSVRFEGQWEGPREKKQVIKFVVDGGYVFFGEPSLTERVRRAGSVDSEAERICKPDAPLPYALFSDQGGTKAIIMLTGEGDDWYSMEIEIAGDGKYVLSIDFVYDENELDAQATSPSIS